MNNDSASTRVLRHLEAKIETGLAGDRLPSVRTLTAELSVSPSTVTMAVQELTRRGLVETASGRGTFIVQPTTAATDVGDYGWQSVALGDFGVVDQDILAPVQVKPTADTVDFASGYPDSSCQPVNLIAKALRNAARRPEVFDRAQREGIPALRRWFAQRIDPSGRHRVLVCPGGQSALSLAFRSLARPGDPIAVSSPTYHGAIVAARAAQLTPVALPLDDEGLVVDELEAAVKATGLRLVYTQPTYHNPTGVVMSTERRRQLIALAEKHRLLIVEDDSMAELGPAQHLPLPLAATDVNGHVVHLYSLTKPVSPGLRIAGLASVGMVAQRLLRVRSAENFFISPILQDVALSVVTDRSWPGHIRSLRSELASRQQVQLNALHAAADWPKQWSQGPCYLWCDTPRGVSSEEFSNAALRHGVAVVAGSAFYPTESEHEQVRLAVPNVSMAEIETGAARLAEALASLR